MQYAFKHRKMGRDELQVPGRIAGSHSREWLIFSSSPTKNFLCVGRHRVMVLVRMTGMVTKDISFPNVLLFSDAEYCYKCTVYKASVTEDETPCQT